MSPGRKRDGIREDGTVLSPEDLDITGDETVAEIDEGRYVIGAGGPPNVEARPDTEREPTPGVPDRKTVADLQRESEAREARQSAPSVESITGADVKRWIGRELHRTDSQYAYRIAAKTGRTVSHQQLASDDIGMAFDGLLMWYAQQVGGDTAVEDALGILLAESNIGVKYPVAGMAAYLDRHDLSPDDSIADLLAVIREQEGLVFPLRHRR